MSYARQKTYEAVSVMVGSRPIRQRLADAGMALLILRNPTQGLDPELARKLDRVINELTRDGTMDLEKGTAALTDEEADRSAKSILSLLLAAFGGL